jgi:hypothetical protein
MWLIQWVRYGHQGLESELYLNAAELIDALEQAGEPEASELVREMVTMIEQGH